MKVVLVTLVAVSLWLPSAGLEANPEHAAKHGIRGLWTLSDPSQLPEGCEKVDERWLRAPESSIAKGKGRGHRTHQSLEIARELDVGHAVVNEDVTFAEFYRCPEATLMDRQP